MSFVRPEAQKWLARYRELIWTGAALALGAYWAFFGYGFLPWLGWIVMIMSGLLLFAAVQRVLFGKGQGGTGLVEVDEGQISYLTGVGGGAVAVRELSQLTYDARQSPAIWRLRQAGLGELAIPEDAEGAEKLFDAFAALEGLSPERLIAGQRSAAGQSRVIWQKERHVAIDTARAKLHS